MHTFVFRADASASLGGGHIMRCLALADELRRNGAECIFAHAGDTWNTVPALGLSGHASVELPNSHDTDALSRSVPGGCDWLVVDHYGWNSSDEAGCRPWARHILVIDDLADRPHDCDILLDQTYGRSVSAYDKLAPAGCDLLLGSRYALLRPEFAAARPLSLARRAPSQLQRILVSVGFTDPANVTETVLEGIVGSSLPLMTDVVLGSSAPSLSRVRSIVETHHHTMTLHVDTSSMAELMSKADFCFGAAGSSSWERCCLGLPTALTIVAGNQIEISERLMDSGAIIALGLAKDLSSGDIAKLLQTISHDPGRLVDLTSRSANICDGRGVQRVGMRLQPERTSAGRSVWLRPATSDDLELTYQWQCQPETRRFSRSTAAPSRGEHEAWFLARLNDAAVLFCVVVCDGDDVGFVRLDRRDASSYEISIAISSGFHGQGFGLAALKLAPRLVPDARIDAEILPGNSRSEALFTKAGYLPKGYGWRSVAPIAATDHSHGTLGIHS